MREIAVPLFRLASFVSYIKLGMSLGMRLALVLQNYVYGKRMTAHSV